MSVEYEVEAIVGHQPEDYNYDNYKKGQIHSYEVKWRGFSYEENTWEDAVSKEVEIPSLINEYWWSKYPMYRPKNSFKREF